MQYLTPTEQLNWTHTTYNGSQLANLALTLSSASILNVSHIHIEIRVWLIAL